MSHNKTDHSYTLKTIRKEQEEMIRGEPMSWHGNQDSILLVMNSRPILLPFLRDLLVSFANLKVFCHDLEEEGPTLSVRVPRIRNIPGTIVHARDFESTASNPIPFPSRVIAFDQQDKSYVRSPSSARE